MAILEVKDVRKTFGKTELLKGITFTLEHDEAPAINGIVTVLLAELERK